MTPGTLSIAKQISTIGRPESPITRTAINDSDTRWMRQYQLVQDETGVIDARIWPLRNPSPEALALLKSRLEEKTAGTEVRVTLVDSMELSPSGKFRLCRSTGD